MFLFNAWIIFRLSVCTAFCWQIHHLINIWVVYQLTVVYQLLGTLFLESDDSIQVPDLLVPGLLCSVLSMNFHPLRTSGFPCGLSYLLACLAFPHRTINVSLWLSTLNMLPSSFTSILSWISPYIYLDLRLTCLLKTVHSTNTVNKSVNKAKSLTFVGTLNSSRT